MIRFSRFMGLLFLSQDPKGSEAGGVFIGNFVC
jgi:hypothetical protein